MIHTRIFVYFGLLVFQIALKVLLSRLDEETKCFVKDLTKKLPEGSSDHRRASSLLFREILDKDCIRFWNSKISPSLKSLQRVISQEEVDESQYERINPFLLEKIAKSRG